MRVLLLLIVLVGNGGCARKYVVGARGSAASAAYLVGEETVTDRRTGLEWQRGWPRRAFAWPEAKSYCDALELADSKDWRLPSSGELASIHTRDARFERPAIDSTGFSDTPRSAFWSSTPSGEPKSLSFEDKLRPGVRMRVSARPDVIVVAVAQCQSRGWHSARRYPALSAEAYALAVDFGRSEYIFEPRCTSASRLLVRCVRGKPNDKVRR